MKAYTGIGSRTTPVWCRFAMEDIASKMADKGYTLRSGSAQGADSAFEIGCDRVAGAGDIYIPWNGFGTGSENMFKFYHTISNRQFEKAKKIYLETGIIKNFDSMKQSVQKLHARNYLQVVGHYDRVIPSKVCIFFAEVDWVTDEPVGGTRSAVLLSKHFGVPTYNLKDDKAFEKVSKMLDIKSKQWYIDNQDILLNNIRRI